MRATGPLCRWVATVVACVVVASCGSSSPQTTAPTGTPPPLYSLSPLDRLGNTLSRLGVEANATDPHGVFQDLAAAINAASAAGASTEAIRDAVDAAYIDAVSTPLGAREMATNDRAVHGEAADIIATPRSASTSTLPLALVGLPAGLPFDESGVLTAQKPKVHFYFVNGVLNSEGQSDATANLVATRLSAQFKTQVTVTTVYNASAFDTSLSMVDGCAAGRESVERHPIPETKQLVDSVCTFAHGCTALGTALPTDVEMVVSAAQLATQKLADLDLASDPVNLRLAKMVRDDVEKNNAKVILISHSQGTLFIRNLLPRLSDLPPGSVGAFYVAPAFGSGTDLTTPQSRYVILRGDWIQSLSGSMPVDPSQGQGDGPVHLHLMTTYLEEGSPSLGVFLKGVQELMDSLGGEAQGPTPSRASAIAGGRGMGLRSAAMPRQAQPDPSSACDGANASGAPQPTTSPVAPGTNTWAGVWNTDFGRMTLDASGSGAYEGFSPGTVAGTVKPDGVLEGTWSQPGPPAKKGTFRWTMGSGGQGFGGDWAYEGGGCGTACGWSGTCIEGPCLNNASANGVPTGRRWGSPLAFFRAATATKQPTL